MEDTYAKFIQDAQNSVGSDYAKSVLESYRQYDGDTGGLVRSIADIFQNSFLNIDFAADWIGPAVCILLLFLLFHMVQNLFKKPRGGRCGSVFFKYGVSGHSRCASI